MEVRAETQTGRLGGSICPAGTTSLNSCCAGGISSPLREGTPLPFVCSPAGLEVASGSAVISEVEGNAQWVWGARLPASGP